MTIERTDDKAYPFVIRDGWGGKAFCDERGLKEIEKEIKKLLTEKKK